MNQHVVVKGGWLPVPEDMYKATGISESDILKTKAWGKVIPMMRKIGDFVLSRYLANDPRMAMVTKWKERYCTGPNKAKKLAMISPVVGFIYIFDSFKCHRGADDLGRERGAWRRKLHSQVNSHAGWKRCHAALAKIIHNRFNMAADNPTRVASIAKREQQKQADYPWAFVDYTNLGEPTCANMRAAISSEAPAVEATAPAPAAPIDPVGEEVLATIEKASPVVKNHVPKASEPPAPLPSAPLPEAQTAVDAEGDYPAVTAEDYDDGDSDDGDAPGPSHDMDDDDDDLKPMEYDDDSSINTEGFPVKDAVPKEPAAVPLAAAPSASPPPPTPPPSGVPLGVVETDATEPAPLTDEAPPPAAADEVMADVPPHPPAPPPAPAPTAVAEEEVIPVPAVTMIDLFRDEGDAEELAEILTPPPPPPPDAQAQKIQQLEAQIARLQQQIQAPPDVMPEDLNKLKEVTAQLRQEIEQKENEKKDLLARSEAQMKEYEEKQAQWDKERAAHERALEQAQEAAEERQKEYQNLLDKKAKKMESLQKRYDSKEEALTLLQKEHDELKRKEEEVRTEFDNLKAEHDALAERAAQATREDAEELMELRAKGDELMRKADATTDQLNNLETKLKQQAATIDGLQREKEDLLNQKKIVEDAAKQSAEKMTKEYLKKVADLQTEHLKKIQEVENEAAAIATQSTQAEANQKHNEIVSKLRAEYETGLEALRLLDEQKREEMKLAMAQERKEALKAIEANAEEYRKKFEAAQQQVQAQQQQLEEKQLRVEAAAENAKRVTELTTQIQEALKQVHEKDETIQELQAKVATNENLAKEARDELNKLFAESKAAADQLQGQLNAASTRHMNEMNNLRQQYESQLATFKKSNEELQNTKNELNKALEAYKRTAEESTQNMEALDASINDIRAELDAKKEELARVQGERSDLNKQLTSFRESHTKLQETLEKLKTENLSEKEQREAVLAQLQQEVGRITGEKNQLQDQLKKQKMVEASQARLEDEIARLNQTVQSYTSFIAAIKRRFKELAPEGSTSDNFLENLQRQVMQLQEAQRNLKEANERNKQLAQEKETISETAKRDEEDLRNQIQGLEQRLNEKVRELAGMNAELRNANEKVSSLQRELFELNAEKSRLLEEYQKKERSLQDKVTELTEETRKGATRLEEVQRQSDTKLKEAEDRCLTLAAQLEQAQKEAQAAAEKVAALDQQGADAVMSEIAEATNNVVEEVKGGIKRRRTGDNEEVRIVNGEEQESEVNLRVDNAEGTNTAPQSRILTQEPDLFLMRTRNPVSGCELVVGKINYAGQIFYIQADLTETMAGPEVVKESIKVFDKNHGPLNRDVHKWVFDHFQFDTMLPDLINNNLKDPEAVSTDNPIDNLTQIQRWYQKDAIERKNANLEAETPTTEETEEIERRIYDPAHLNEVFVRLWKGEKRKTIQWSKLVPALLQKIHGYLERKRIKMLDFLKQDVFNPDKYEGVVPDAWIRSYAQAISSPEAAEQSYINLQSKITQDGVKIPLQYALRRLVRRLKHLAKKTGLLYLNPSLIYAMIVYYMRQGMGTRSTTFGFGYHNSSTSTTSTGFGRVAIPFTTPDMQNRGLYDYFGYGSDVFSPNLNNPPTYYAHDYTGYGYGY